jgi:hypothetical protein
MSLSLSLSLSLCNSWATPNARIPLIPTIVAPMGNASKKEKADHSKLGNAAKKMKARRSNK